MSGENWSALGLSSDPVPGDPINVRALATYAQRETEMWCEHANALRDTAGFGAEMPMEGDFAATYRARIRTLPERASALVSAHQGGGTALAQYAMRLEAAQSEARVALRQGIQAREVGAQATRVYEQAVTAMNALPKLVPPEQYPYVVQQYEMLQAEATMALQQVNAAKMQWQAAQQEALRAGEEARLAESACAQTVREVTPRTTASARRSASGGGLLAPVTAAGRAGRVPPSPPHDLDEGSVAKVVPFADKTTARQGLEGDLQPVANRFFRGATGKSRDFQVIVLRDGTVRMQFFSPANNPGYGKMYVQTIDSSGRVLQEFKDTMGPDGLIQRKWIHGEP